jgi:hypothetical protein
VFSSLRACSIVTPGLSTPNAATIRMLRPFIIIGADRNGHAPAGIQMSFSLG